MLKSMIVFHLGLRSGGSGATRMTEKHQLPQGGNLCGVPTTIRTREIIHCLIDKFCTNTLPQVQLTFI